jgi:hypothetical protein
MMSLTRAEAQRAALVIHSQASLRLQIRNYGLGGGALYGSAATHTSTKTRTTAGEDKRAFI